MTDRAKLEEILRLATEMLADLPSVEPIPAQKPEPAKRVSGEMPIDWGAWAFTNDAGKQDFSSYANGEADLKPAWHTDSNSKVKTNPNVTYITFPVEFDFELERIELYDGEGKSTLPVKFHAILRDGYEQVNDIIPPFLSADYKKWFKYEVKQEARKVRAVVIEVPMTTNLPPASLPADYRFYGSWKAYEPPVITPPKAPAENAFGAVGYLWSFYKGSRGGIDQDRMDVAKAVHGIRLWVDKENIIEPTTGRYTFDIAYKGGWGIDAILQALHEQGNEVMICPKNMLGQREYAETCRQIAIRYGSNKAYPASEAKIYTDPLNAWPGDTARNTVKVGLGLVKKIQLDNERNGSWKQRFNPETYANPDGFLTPEEQYHYCAGAYAAIKEVDASIEVVLGGLAATSPGYYIAMEFFKELNGGKEFCDSVAYHDYPKQVGEQRENASSAAAPEQSGFEEHAQLYIRASGLWNNGTPKPVYVTETGTSISDINPDLAVYAIGPYSKWDVQAIFTIRLALAGLRGGLAANYFYQLYDDTKYISNPTASGVNWDLSNGIADRNTFIDGKQVHKRRPATDYTYQLLPLIKGYTHAETIKGAVWVDRFTKPGAPDLYAVYVPQYADVTVPYLLQLPGVKQITVYNLQAGQDSPKEEKVAIDGTYSMEVSMKPVFVLSN